MVEPPGAGAHIRLYIPIKMDLVGECLEIFGKTNMAEQRKHRHFAGTKSEAMPEEPLATYGKYVDIKLLCHSFLL